MTSSKESPSDKDYAPVHDDDLEEGPDSDWESDEDSPSPHDSAKPSAPPSKLLQERHHLEFMTIIFGASALAFNAGFVNGSTYQFRNMPVSHITGTTTHAGMYIGNKDYEDFTINLALIVCFIFGSAITGSLMNHDTFHLGRSYGPLFLIGSGLFLIACIFSVAYPESDMYFYFAAMACGLQNSMTTRYSGSVIRTTHMTGAGTDIGLALGRIAMGEHKEIWKLQLLCPLLVSFMVGGCASVYAYRRMGQLTLLVNVFVFFFIGVAYSIVVGMQLHIPFWKALFGFYTHIESKVKQGAHQMDDAAKKVKQHMVALVKVNPMHKQFKTKASGRKQKAKAAPVKAVPVKAVPSADSLHDHQDIC